MQQRGVFDMSTKNWPKLVCLALIASSFVAGCGPVKFAAKSSNNVDSSGKDPIDGGGGGKDPTDPTNPTNPTDPTDPTNPTNPTNPTDPTPPTLRDVSATTTVDPKNNKLDIVLVVDDSNSMLEDNLKLASKLQGFVSKLEGTQLDWQMCLTVTRAVNTNAWGASTFWQTSDLKNDRSNYILKKGMYTSSQLNNVFKHTMSFVGAGWAGSDDERAIYAMWYHIYNGDYKYSDASGCYRRDSAVTYIIISDEDERSVGGDASQALYNGEYKALETKDQPTEFVRAFKETFGADKRFTVNSIIVQPGDTSCKASQDTATAKSHYGVKYKELSTLTGGGVSSICASDFGVNLDSFINNIQGSLSSLPLECPPYQGNVGVSFTPNIGGMTTTVQGSSLVFSKVVPVGTKVSVTYKCAEVRTPSSVTKPISFNKPGFFEKLVMFVKNLFIW